MTKEHPYPRWLKPYVKGMFKATRHSVSVGGLTPKPGKLNGPGDTHSQTLRVLCHTCNNVDFGKIQEAAKGVVLPLILGRWTLLSEEDRRLVAIWAIMTTIVIESAHPETATVPRPERHEFRKQKTPPELWTVWIGRHEGPQSGVFNHVAWSLGGGTTPALGGYGVTEMHNNQTTGWVLRDLFILTFRATWNTGAVKDQLAQSIASEFGISVVWPITQTWKLPVVALDELGWNKASRAISKTFGIKERFSFNLPQ